VEIVPFMNIGIGPWDDFCQKSDDAWFFHTSHLLEYTLAYRPDLQGQNCSFAVVEQGVILAVCPLILECADYGGITFNEFAYAGEPCPAPAVRNGLQKKKRGNVLDLVFQQIDQTAQDTGVGRSAMRFYASSNSYADSQSIPLNFMVQYGYLENSLFTQLLDLTCDEDVILKSMRKGHKHCVKQAQNFFDLVIYDERTISPEVFAAYQALHAKAAGRVTRSQSTFDFMFKWIKEGMAVLGSARADEEFIGFALAFAFKEGGLYASACNDPEFDGRSIGQGIQWGLIRYLKERGIKHYDMGLQFWGSQLHYSPDPKAIAISSFKRGFGGTTIPIFFGEKYYDESLFRRIMGGRIDGYCESQFVDKMRNS
jgi:hypothetical protein